MSRVLNKGKIAALILFFVCAIVLIIATSIEQEPPIEFADDNLKNAIGQAIGIVEGDIRKSDVANLIDLDASKRDIKYLDGIEYLKSLQVLILEGNKVEDVNPLASLIELEKLILTNNKISDITPLKHLENLRELSLWVNQVEDISSLSHLKNLQILFLDGNNVSDISPLSELFNLTTLGLWDNNIEDITPLKNLENLEFLHLWDNPVDTSETSTTRQIIDKLIEQGCNVQY